ncbi:hypothetical protein QYF36_011300 [Acer negundo]|nr:hypothetical protein QYF36_011300 [Acer negundo]
MNNFNVSGYHYNVLTSVGVVPENHSTLTNGTTLTFWEPLWRWIQRQSCFWEQLLIGNHFNIVGNHFNVLVYVEVVPETRGRIWILISSGCRHLCVTIDPPQTCISEFPSNESLYKIVVVALSQCGSDPIPMDVTTFASWLHHGDPSRNNY